MNKFIAEAMRASSHHEVEEISLEREIALTLEAEDIRWKMVNELADAHRSIELCEALEGMAFVAAEIHEPTPQQAALISIGGDLAVAGTDMTGEEVTPSLEDFAMNGAASPDTASKVRSVIDQVLKTLRELLARIAKAVHAYLQAVRSAAGGQVQRQKMIKERIRELGGKHTVDKEISFAFPIGENDRAISNFSDLTREAVRFAVGVDAFLKDANEFNIGYTSALVQLYASFLGEKTSVVEHFQKLRVVADATTRGASRRASESISGQNNDYFDIKKVEYDHLLGGIMIVKTSAVMKADPDELSSASFRQAIDEMVSHVGIKVKLSEGGFSKETFECKPMQGTDLDTAVKVVDELIDHYTGRSEHTSVSAAAERRGDFAETSVEHIAKYIERFPKNDVSGKEFALAAQRVSTSIMTNATVPYTSMTSALGRVITLMQSAILKSLGAHEKHRETTSSNESISEELVYSEEGLFGDVIGSIKKALGIRKPTKLNLHKIESGYRELKELRSKVQKNYIQTTHEVKTGEVAGGNVVPYLFAAKASQDPMALPGEWSAALQSAGGAMTHLADMMAKSGMEGYAIFKKYKGLEKSVDNFKKQEAEFAQFLKKWGAPAKPNLVGVLKNFQLDDMSLLGKNPDIAMWNEQKQWAMSNLRPSIKAATSNAKLPALTSEQVPKVGTAMTEAIDFLMNHQLADIIKDTSETLMNIEYGHEVVTYNYEWITGEFEKKTLTEHDVVCSWLVESAGDQYRFLYFSILLEYFVAIIEMILAADRWISASIKD